MNWKCVFDILFEECFKLKALCIWVWVCRQFVLGECDRRGRTKNMRSEEFSQSSWDKQKTKNKNRGSCFEIIAGHGPVSRIVVLFCSVLFCSVLFWFAFVRGLEFQYFYVLDLQCQRANLADSTQRGRVTPESLSPPILPLPTLTAVAAIAAVTDSTYMCRNMAVRCLPLTAVILYI